MAHESYKVTIGTASDDRDIAIVIAGQTLKRINDFLDKRKFESIIMDVHAHGGDRQQYGISFDVMYECSDEEYFETIENKLSLNANVESVEVLTKDLSPRSPYI